MKMKSVEGVIVVIYFLCALNRFTNAQDNVTEVSNTTAISVTTVSPTTVPEDEDDEDAFNINVPYCFNFTWLGPRYDNSTSYNGSCTEWKSENPTSGIPCADPFVVTYDGSEPNIDYIWTNHRSSVLCRQATGDSCIKWSYYFNNALQNVTRMCGRVYTEKGDPVSKGCYTQVVNGYTIEFCVCRSSSGGLKPCNNANTISGFKIGLTFTTALLFYYYALCYS
ncbi:uncharacterized protein LOC108743052 [Agrilus planipennis]|uniref:Uncharacterized protein LOC108743052 n=1 Tax=Agrilus planipennis TaxID=224129 RepID=A0A1W4XCW1_AGRPL|nr:uncharacterized protein LOC108743052 [Agrilus planipennis]